MKKFLILLISIVISILFIAGCSPSIKDAETHFDDIEPIQTGYDPGLKNVLVIHSYHKEWGWNIDTEKGIKEGLEKGGYVLNKDYAFEAFYMDTKDRYTTPEQIRMRSEQAIALIEEYNPDLVFVNDDNALKHVAVPYTLQNPDKKLPFVFSGINSNPTIYEPIDSLKEPGYSITGALERFPYYQSFSLAKRILKNRTRIVLFADSSPSSDFLAGAFKERYLEKVKDSPLDVMGIVQVDTFKEWKEKVNEYQDKSDFLGILTYHQLKDEEGNVVHASEVVLWTINNNKLPEIGFLQFHAEDGFWSAIGVSPLKTGRYIGEIGADILKGKDPGDIPIIDPKLVDVAFNLERSKMLGIEIPIDILGMASAAYLEIKMPRY
ncbi:MAG: hypothetical protein KAK00_00670 [Nanoarchaeota archaeon]|nr:hypothetical protein [Nanoarchaeota archaeon]